MRDGECAWCGSTDRLLRTEYDTSTVHDARMATIPHMTLCVNCADDLTEYMKYRARASDGESEARDDEPEFGFTSAEAVAIVDLLREHPGLELVTRSRFRIRYHDGDWQEFGYVIGDPRLRTFTEAEIVDRLRSMRECDLRTLDEAAWDLPD